MLTGILKWIFKHFAPYFFGIFVGVGFFFLLKHFLPMLPEMPLLDWPKWYIAQEVPPAPAEQPDEHASAGEAAHEVQNGDVAAEVRATDLQAASVPSSVGQSAVGPMDQSTLDQAVHDAGAPAQERPDAAHDPRATQSDRMATSSSGTPSEAMEEEGPREARPHVSTNLPSQIAPSAPIAGAPIAGAPIAGAPVAKEERDARVEWQASERADSQKDSCGTAPGVPGMAMDRYLACQWRVNCLNRLSRARTLIEQDRQQCPTEGPNARSCVTYYRALEQQYHPAMCNNWPAYRAPGRW